MKKPGRTKRTYRMGARARGVEATRERILRCAYELWILEPYEAVTLDTVAARARVSKQTVIRQFSSKDALAVAVVDWQRPREEAGRQTAPGDVATALAKLLQRYEAMGDANTRLLEVERSIAAIQYAMSQARESHRAWVEHVFGPFLPKRRGAARERRVMAFYAATEVYLWKLLRRDFALSRGTTRAVFQQLVDGLIQPSHRGGRKKRR